MPEESTAEQNQPNGRTLRERYTLVRPTVKQSVKESLQDNPLLDRKSAQRGAFRAAEKGINDPLTGFLRRDGFMTLVNRELAMINRSNGSLGAVFAISDLDDFGVINKERGVSTGDKVLSDSSHKVTANLRKSDIAGRWGGEEFTYFLPFQDRNQLLDKTSTRIHEGLTLEYPEENLRVTASVGSTEYIPGEPFEQLFERADLAMRVAKLLGKNRSVHGEVNNGEIYLNDGRDHTSYRYIKDNDGVEYLFDGKNDLNYIITKDENGKPKLQLSI